MWTAYWGRLLPNWGRHTDAFSVPEHHTWALGAAHNPSCPRWERDFLSTLSKRCATCMWCPKSVLRFRWGKSLFILASSHIALENGRCSALRSATIATSLFPHPSSFSHGWETLGAHSSCSCSLFNETFGICKDYFVGLGKQVPVYCDEKCILLGFLWASLYWPNLSPRTTVTHLPGSSWIEALSSQLSDGSQAGAWSKCGFLLMN